MAGIKTTNMNALLTVAFSTILLTQSFLLAARASLTPSARPVLHVGVPLHTVLRFSLVAGGELDEITVTGAQREREFSI